MDVRFDYNDTISTANANIERVIENPKTVPYGVRHTRDFYRGKSFRFAGK